MPEAGTTGTFDTVVLEYTLNLCPGLEEMRATVRDALKLTVKGGTVVAISRACDSGSELAEAMVRMGVDPNELGVSNLTNKEIACLRPKEAVLLVSHVTLRQADLDDYPESADDNKQKALEFATRVRQSAVPPDIRGTFPERFVTKIIDIGLVWHHR